MASLFDDDKTDDIGKDVDDAVSAVPVEVAPRANPDFFGHEDIEKSLLQDCLTGRLPHALVLAGSPGIGKATLAFRLVRFLFSGGADQQEAGLFGEEPPPVSLHVAPEHPVFRRVASSGHADLLTVEREFDEKKGRFKNDISVDAVRRIHPFVRMTAAEGSWRAVIVDGAEYLNASSKNALLKVLEEPPKKTVLILTTSQPGSLLPTIRSRCRMVFMEPLPEKTVGDLLDKRVQGLDADEKVLLSRLSQGSIGKALRFYQEDGIALYHQLLDVVSTMPKLDMVMVHDLAEKLGKRGAEESYATATEIMIGWCGRQACAEARGLPPDDILPGDAGTFQNIGGLHSPGYFFRVWEKISQIVLQTKISNLDKRLTIINAFLALQQGK